MCSSSPNQENQDETSVPPSVTPRLPIQQFLPYNPFLPFPLLPGWALSSHTPRPGESLLTFIGTCLSTARENSEKPNPWLSVCTPGGGPEPEVSSKPREAERSLRGWCLQKAAMSTVCPPSIHPCPSPAKDVTEVRRHVIRSQRWLLCNHTSSFPRVTRTFSCGCGAAFYVFGITMHTGHRILYAWIRSQGTPSKEGFVFTLLFFPLYQSKNDWS